MKKRIIYNFLRFCIVTEFDSTGLNYLEKIADRACKFGLIKANQFVNLTLILNEKFKDLKNVAL